jgi:hypothetical protein
MLSRCSLYQYRFFTALYSSFIKTTFVQNYLPLQVLYRHGSQTTRISSASPSFPLPPQKISFTIQSPFQNHPLIPITKAHRTSSPQTFSPSPSLAPPLLPPVPPSSTILPTSLPILHLPIFKPHIISSALHLRSKSPAQASTVRASFPNPVY